MKTISGIPNGPQFLDCLDTDPPPGQMQWVKRPERTPHYTADTGGVTSDAPGDIGDLVGRVHDYDWKFRGLLCHAVDAQVRAAPEISLDQRAHCEKSLAARHLS